MKSMTGYGIEEIQKDTLSVSVEIKSYNGRFLDIFCGLPPFLSSLESGIRDYIAARSRRGKVEVSVRIREKGSAVKIIVNEKAAAACYESALALAKSLGIRKKPDLSFILGMEGVMETEQNWDIETCGGLVNAALEAAFKKFDAQRLREGRHTKENILARVKTLEDSLERIASRCPELENTIKENLRGRFVELLNDGVDENRVLAETAVLLVKYTIAEEISRLESHLKEFRAEAESNGTPGKKLDFLSQEINREINTIGSKTPVLDVSLEVVVMKDALENIREQLRNIE
ncbi:MAG: YicC family protein [Spirochaetaceae bacterium]|jgi:uncharacterized protein (TIGR00255 family)|nr:YicC family protein [Spirochaetaceae bacterium]